MEPRWQQLLYTWSASVSLTVADVEMVHSRNRRLDLSPEAWGVDLLSCRREGAAFLRALNLEVGQRLRREALTATSALLISGFSEVGVALPWYPATCRGSMIEAWPTPTNGRPTSTRPASIRRAGRTKSGNMMWHNFVSDFVNEEARLSHLASQAHLHDVGVMSGPAVQLADGNDVAAAGASSSRLRPSRSWRPIDYFRDRHIKHMRACGVSKNWVSKDAWQEVRDKFASLSDLERQEFEHMAAKSKGAARSRRLEDRFMGCHARTMGAWQHLSGSDADGCSCCPICTGA